MKAPFQPDLPMSEAPRDGTPVRLRLHDGSAFVGYHSDRWWGWVAILDPCPLIRADVRFAGWEPIASEDLRQIRQELMFPPVAVAAVLAIPRPAVIVTARKPRRR